MNFIKNRKLWLTISTIAIIVSILSLFINGLNFGIDFTGGSLLEIQVSQEISSDDIRNTLEQIENSEELLGKPKIQASNVMNDQKNTFIIRTKELNDEKHINVIKSLGTLASFEELSFTRIGPVVGEDLKNKAVTAIILAIILIIIYITLAFRKMPSQIKSTRFGIVAVITLAHDIIITLGLFSLLGYEVDTLFITAMLTILGFSVNDTIVVFDRLRETVIRRIHPTFEANAESSIKSTIMRSINTSLTLLITLLALYFLAGTSIQHFIFALIVGIAIGTYSSIFVATPLLVVWNDYIGKEQNPKLNNSKVKKTSNNTNANSSGNTLSKKKLKKNKNRR